VGVAAPTGAIVSLYYDGSRFGRDVRAGDVLETDTGRRYLIVTMRRQLVGKHAGRLHLSCVVVAEAPEGATVHPLHWYKRGRAPVR
jgi:hypothetical protein